MTVSIHRNTPVTALSQKPNGEWLVGTNKGTITAEQVVVAAKIQQQCECFSFVTDPFNFWGGGNSEGKGCALG